MIQIWKFFTINFLAISANLRKKNEVKDRDVVRRKTAVLVINSNYSSKSGLGSLKGPQRDLTIAKKLFAAKKL